MAIQTALNIIGGAGTSKFIAIEAAAMMATNTAGATFAQDEGATYGINQPVFMFDGDSDTSVQFRIPQVDGLIKSLNFNAKLKMKRYTAADANYDVVFTVAAVFLAANEDSVDYAHPTAITTTLTNEGDTYFSTSEAVAADGTLADNGWLLINITRVGTAVADTLDGYAGLIGIELEINQ